MFARASSLMFPLEGTGSTQTGPGKQCSTINVLSSVFQMPSPAGPLDCIVRYALGVKVSHDSVAECVAPSLPKLTAVLVAVIPLWTSSLPSEIPPTSVWEVLVTTARISLETLPN